MSKRPERLIGPERRGNKWRIRLRAADGTETPIYYALEEEHKAREFARVFHEEATDRSIGSTVTEYLDHLKRFGGSKRRPLRERSLVIMRCKLVGILGLVDREAARKNRGRRGPEVPVYNDRPLDTLTPNAAQRLYTASVKSGLATDSHRSYLVAGGAFGGWCAERGYLKVNPFADVLPEGELSAGKQKLTLDEARKFIAAAYADPHPLGGIAAAALLTLGTRSMELLDATVRSLDDRGRVLRIARSKTLAGVRPVQVPPVLRARLLKLAAGQAPDAWLFGEMTQGTLLNHVRRLCEVAGVPSVCAHGLRGTQITLTVEVAGMIAVAGRAAGHASAGVTRRHYMESGTEESARAAQMEAMLFAPEESEELTDELAIAEQEARDAAAKLEGLRARQVQLRLGSDPKTPIPTTSETN